MFCHEIDSLDHCLQCNRFSSILRFSSITEIFPFFSSRHSSSFGFCVCHGSRNRALLITKIPVDCRACQQYSDGTNSRFTLLRRVETFCSHSRELRFQHRTHPPRFCAPFILGVDVGNEYFSGNKDSTQERTAYHEIENADYENYKNLYWSLIHPV